MKKNYERFISKISFTIAIVLFIFSLLPSFNYSVNIGASVGNWTDNYSNYQNYLFTPYQIASETWVDISTPEQLANVCVYINSKGVKYNINLLASLDMSNHYWIPFKNFSGTFEGNGYKIYNLRIKPIINPWGDQYNTGLFGYTTNATIKNLQLGIYSLHINVDAYKNNVGALVGYADAVTTISNCQVEKSVSDITFSSSNKTIGWDKELCYGGLVGFSYFTTITNCKTNILMYVQYGEYNVICMGGILGFGFNTNISLCSKNNKTQNNKSITKYSNVGGIVGYISTANGSDYGNQITQCCNYGQVYSHSKNLTYAGGIVGNLIKADTPNAKVENCYNMARVSGECESSTTREIYRVGDNKSNELKKQLYGFVYNSDANGDLQIDDSNFASTPYYSYIPSHFTSSVVIQNIVVNETSLNSYVGGICGACDSLINYCYNTGKLNDRTNSYNANYKVIFINSLQPLSSDLYNNGELFNFSFTYDVTYKSYKICGNDTIYNNCYVINELNATTGNVNINAVVSNNNGQASYDSATIANNYSTLYTAYTFQHYGSNYGYTIKITNNLNQIDIYVSGLVYNYNKGEIVDQGGYVTLGYFSKLLPSSLLTTSNVDPLDLLPSEFDSNIWGINSVINKGRPYLKGMYWQHAIATPTYQQISYVFNTTDNTAIVRGANNISEINIPATVNYQGGSYTVTEIASNAFQDSSNLERVVLPNTIEKIGMNAFENCTKLKNVVLPSSLKEIRNNAFKGCTSLKDIILPNGMSEIKYGTFMGCTSLTSITIPNSVEIINSFAFSGCTSLKQVKMFNGISTIHNSAFADCQSLTEMLLPNTISFIGPSAFKNCVNLQKINIPTNLQNIQPYTFYNCISLKSSSGTSFVIPESVKFIGERAFFNCGSITYLILYNNLYSLGTDCLFGINSATVIYNGTVARWKSLTGEDKNNVSLCNSKVVCSDGTLTYIGYILQEN